MGVVDLTSRREAWVPEIHRALAAGVEEGAFPGGVAVVVRDGRRVHESAAGQAQVKPSAQPAYPDTLYDLASLTKILATTPLAAVLVGQRALAIDDCAGRFLPEFSSGPKAVVTVRHLLAHCAGLPAWRPYFLQAMKDPTAGLLFGVRDESRRAAASQRGRALLRSLALAEPLERPPGQEAVYSDVGFLVLGAILEKVAGGPIDETCRRMVFEPLKLASLHFRPLDREPALPPGFIVDSIAATGSVRPREPAIGQEAMLAEVPREPDLRRGEVDDDNAYAMGGLASHAGLFGHARDVAAFGQAVVEETSGAGRLAPAHVWAQFLARDATLGSTRTLGFDTPSVGDAQAGRWFTKGRSVGHLGFTGTSLWIDLERRLSVALITNRVHPSRGNAAIRAARPRFHDAVVVALFGEPAVG